MFGELNLDDNSNPLAKNLPKASEITVFNKT